MTATIQTLAGQLGAAIAAMPTHTIGDCIEQDRVLAAVIRTITEGAEGDAYSILRDAADDVLATVDKWEDA